MNPGTAMAVELDNPAHVADFLRLNGLWLRDTFGAEVAGRELAADPWDIVRTGGHILARVEEGGVVGVCALLRETPGRWQLVRMAVDPAARGQGHGDALLRAALELARQEGGREIHLQSSTALGPALALYRKHGFGELPAAVGQERSQCNVRMGRTL